MKVAVPTETFPGERRVALIPGDISSLGKAKLEILVQKGAGEAAGFSDQDYADKGATIVENRGELLSQADIVVQVRSLGANKNEGQQDLEHFKSDQVVIGLSDPLGEPESAKKLAEKGVMAFSMEMIPRISRAQSMDALSSMATIAGYKAVLLGASESRKIFPMLMTAAGMVKPSRVFIIGAGVAGLQAIATAKRLGSVVEAYDVRPAVKEQCESLGAKFVELELETDDGAEDKGGYATELGEDFYRKQREVMTRVVSNSDVVVTTAAIPGKKSPILITTDMVDKMAPGSVIVDLAAERGGNCELTKADERVDYNGVVILGPTNLPATIPNHASQMYSRNITTLLKSLVKEGELNIDMEDEVTAGTLVSRGGDVVHERIKGLLEPQAESEE
ncbi:MAG: Re/Si-specific NAD(P)(+) transhydrogenase subunit alpha [Myxococcota bacterium]|nr:Re/Si-specific NAD(P)(+) transhydrogenase subunit alpha [Myxococcota bacterium]